MIKRIHVNKHHIASNRKHGTRLPALTCKTYKANHRGNRVYIDGPSELIYRPEKPLSCGAVAWIETEAAVMVDGKYV